MEPLSVMTDITNLNIFDLYAGDKLPAWKKSIAFSFTLKGDGTMTSEQINTVVQKVVKEAEKYGATLRS